MNVKEIFKQIKKPFKKTVNFLPTPLPKGLTAFHAWCDDIIATYDLPDNRTLRWTLAVQIIHLGATESLKPKRFFGKSCHKAMSNEIASYVMKDLKEQQDQQMKAEEEVKSKAKLEATKALEAAPSEPQQ